MKTLILSALLLGTASAAPIKAPIKIVAAENFYGQVAQTIGGANVQVTSILSNPNQDPHLFEASASTARSLAGADIVVESGADYDPWMDKLLAASRATGRTTITVASLVGRKSGDNPHLWYDPATMPAYAKALSAELTKRDPAHKTQYGANLNAFLASLKPLSTQIATLKGRFAGTSVTATEPVFGYMAGALGLNMRNGAFQLAVMNDTEPSASQTAAFETDLKQKRVKVLLYNSQVIDPSTTRLLNIAKAAGVPVVPVTETLPAGKTYLSWMQSQLTALAGALSHR